MKEKYYFLNSLNIGIIVLNESKKIVFINEWLLKKIAPETGVRNGDFLDYPKDKYIRFNQALTEAIEGGRSSVLTMQLNPIPIELFHGEISLSYNLSISRLSKGHDKAVRVLLQFTDVTQVKEREKFLQEKQREIDSQREKSFYQERLSSLGELTTSIAHEINNPLAILKMNYMTIRKILQRKELLSSDIDEIILEGEETIQRITNLIKSVQELAHKSGVDEFSKVTFKEILKSVLIVFTEKSRSTGIDLRIDLSKEVFQVPIEANRSLIGQVFVNLLNNAFHAVKEREEKWISIDGEVFEDSITLRLIDSGEGIKKEIKEKIFLPFYTTKDIGEGTGLGLSTNLKIIQSHSGELYIDDENPNTCFVVHLPIKQAQK